MTARVSPSTARKGALKLIRRRLELQREGKSVQSPAPFADHLVAILRPACMADPAPDSPAYRSHVEANFHNAFVALCRTTPVRARRS